MAAACFYLSWANTARAINGSGSCGDGTDGLQGVRRVGTRWWAAGR